MRGPLIAFAGLSLASLALYLRDPHVTGSWGFCASAYAMGVYCPACGGLRAVNDLTHLQVGQAASSNLLFLIAVPVIGYLLLRWLVTAWKGTPFGRTIWWSRGSLIFWVAATVVFTVARNLPFGAWLAP